MKDLEVYIHIPFCERKCKYCNFVSYCVKNNIITQYIDKLVLELKFKLNKGYNIKTIFFGGGTPSLIDEKHIVRLLNTIKNCSLIDKDCEITIECNPNTTSRDKLVSYLNSGINRISFGAQSFNDDLLKKIGRLHSGGQIINAVNLAKEVGFKNISVDIMIGLPSQTLNDVRHDLVNISDLGITHFSCYSLILEEDTPLFNEVSEGKLSLPDDDITIEMYDFVTEFSKSIGYERYEVSNFSLPGFECRHNLGYWEFSEYIGFGVAAHSYFDDFRIYNTSSLLDYISLPFSEIEVRERIDEIEKREEFIMLSLRTKWGIDLIEFNHLFNEDLLETKASKIKDLKNYNLISCDENYLVATEQGFHVLNKIILDLI